MTSTCSDHQRLAKTLAATAALALALLVPAAHASPEDWKIKHYFAGVAPSDVVVGPDGAFWMLDEGEGDRADIGRLVPGHKPTRRHAASQVGSRLAVDGWGRLVFAARDRRGRVVLRRMHLDGRVSDVRLKGVPRLFQARDIKRLIAGPGGTIWMITGNDDVVSVSPSGDVRRVPHPAGVDEFGTSALVGDLAVGADGNISFTAFNGVGSITPNGKLRPWRQAIEEGETLTLMARGTDDALWAGTRSTGKNVRVAADGTPRVYIDFNEPHDPADYTAMIAAPGAAVWPIAAYHGLGDELRNDSIGQVVEQGGKDATFLTSGNISPGLFGAVAGLDGRVWIAARDAFQLYRVALTTADQTSSRGRARMVRTKRAGRFVGVELSCVGRTGGYCTGRLRLRVSGRRAGRAVRFAVPAGPAAVRVLSARWIRLNAAARRAVRRGARVSVVGPGGARRVGRR